VIYPGVNRPGREADHSPSFNTEFKNGAAVPPFTHMSLQRIAYNYINIVYYILYTPPLWSSGQSSWLQIQESGFNSPALPDFPRSSGSGTGSTQPREYN
jgi:hypothetical protein